MFFADQHYAMQLDTYLQRIQYQGPLAVDQQTLCALHRAHLLTIPYENLYIQWYFHNHPDRGPGYGFTLLPRPYASFAPRCHELQTSPDSGFVRTTVCHKFMPDGFASLRGATLKEYRTDSVRQEEIANKSRYRVVLEATFGLAGDLADTLWPGVQERHQRWKAQTGDNHAR